uniref:Uncharacterized protein n=1 Tax=Ascaris lumbricoides TaxID=6252 RepID=A0A0M3HKZ7_ASCLU
MLNAGESVDLDALFGIPLYATAPDDKQVKILMNSDLFLKVKHLSFPQILVSFINFLLFL